MRKLLILLFLTVFGCSKKHVKAVFGKWTEYFRCSEVGEFEQFFKKSSMKASSVDRHRAPSVDRANSQKRDHSFDIGMDQYIPDPLDGGATVPSDGALESPPGSRLLWKIDLRPAYCNEVLQIKLLTY